MTVFLLIITTLFIILTMVVIICGITVRSCLWEILYIVACIYVGSHIGLVWWLAVILSIVLIVFAGAFSYVLNR